MGLFALLFAACSTVKLGYNNADTLLLYSLDRYVSLTDEQEQMVRRREERATALYTLAREVASAVTMDDVLTTATKQISTACSSLANTKRSARLVSLQAWTSKKPSSSVAGSDSGITRTKRSGSDTQGVCPEC